jgi:branched-chain amino acid transport system ATP-binding protein
LFELMDVRAGYGEFKVLHGVSMSLKEKSIISIIGSNGAGKSTLLKAISGLIKIDSGKILFKGQDLGEIPAYDIARMGIVQVPEGRRIFSKMTVEENLLLVLNSKSAKSERGETLREVFGLFPVLKERLKQRAGTLSGGEQQMLAIARALTIKPQLLMLDEPSSGLAPVITKDVFRVIGLLNKERGITVLLVEQNVMAALNLSDYGYVLENGKMALEGTSQNLLDNVETKKAYIGG